MGWTHVSAALAAVLISASSAAEASLWTFEQGGWSPGLLPPTGGLATGYFEGTDIDKDGLLELSEVTDFILSFSGDSIVQDFQHDRADLKFFTYTIGTEVFPPSFPFFSDDGLIFYDADDGTLGINMGPTTERRGILSTFEPMRVTLVPVPVSLPLLATAFGFFALFTRRPSQKNV